MLGRVRRRGREAPARGLPPIDRFWIIEAIRGAGLALVVVCFLIAPGTLQPHPHALRSLTALLAAVGLLAGCAVRLRPATVVPVLRGMLVLDAVYLTVGTQVSGGPTSPLDHALLLHLAAVTLLASARTGIVLAGLETALMVAMRVGVVLHWWPETVPAGVGPAWQQLGVFLVVLWMVASASAALSVVNRRELRRRRHDLDALTLLTERVERAARPAAVAQLLLDAVVSTYGLRRGVVVTLEGGELELLASTALLTDVPREGTSDHVSRAQAEHETVLVPRPVDEPWLSTLLPDAASLLVVPIMADSRALGALVVEPGGSPRHQRRIVAGLERSAAYGALALRNASLMESVQRQAATDGLTRIANRRAFEGALERELNRATRNAEHVSLVMVDIDHFKALNDDLGHQAGDAVLRAAAAALARECREFDTAARYGGEEFAVILPGCGPERAFDIAERLRLAVCASSSGRTITASAGVATFPGHAGDAESLVRAADDALYASKRSGRDRTSVSVGIGPEEQVNALIRRAVRERLRARDGEGNPDDAAHLGAYGRPH